MTWTPPFSEADLRAAMATAISWAETLRLLGYTPKGGNHRTVQRWAARWQISSEHFNPQEGRRRSSRDRAKPLEEVLTENSTYHRGKLKGRLLATGLKQRMCEMCGQGELWHGMKMSLVLDHINGVSNDHRLENLRIVCANCAATLETHCGRNLPRERICPGCGVPFAPRHIRHRYCSQTCWGRVSSVLRTGTSMPEQRKVERPPYDQLLTEVAELGWSAVGRRYGVSDNAVRKWVRWYRAREEASRGPGAAAPGGERGDAVRQGEPGAGSGEDDRAGGRAGEASAPEAAAARSEHVHRQAA